MNVLAASATCTSFNKVAGNGYSRAPDLGSDSKPFVAGKEACLPVNRKNQLVCFVEHAKSSMIASHVLPPPGAGANGVPETQRDWPKA
jgi:hypothetical protein